MPWKSKPKYHAPSASISNYSTDTQAQAVGVKHIVVALFYFAILLAAIGAIPLLIFLTPKPEVGTWFPKGIKCATCAEIEAQNPVLVEAMGCRGIKENHSTTTVTFGGMERCWALERGKDGWLRPMGWTREDMVRWTETQKKEGGVL